MLQNKENHDLFTTSTNFVTFSTNFKNFITLLTTPMPSLTLFIQCKNFATLLTNCTSFVILLTTSVHFLTMLIPYTNFITFLKVKIIAKNYSVGHVRPMLFFCCSCPTKFRKIITGHVRPKHNSTGHFD